MKKANFDIFDEIFENIKHLIPENICESMSNCIYITYYDVTTCKKIIKNKYNSLEDIFESIKRSCFIPYVIDGNLTRKCKYIDGISPYIFPFSINRKILYLDLYGFDKLFYSFTIKNEKTNIHRILAGLLDIHLFFIKQQNTQLCIYIDNASIIYYIRNFIKYIIEICFVYFISFIVFIKKCFPKYNWIKIENHIFLRNQLIYCITNI